MRINVVYNNQIGGCADVLARLEEELITRKVEFQTFDIDSLKEFGDFTIVIGGDGTLLKAARFYTTAPVLLEGSYSTEERLMLQSGNSLALNDFVIKGCKTSRTSKFYLEINGKFVCDYIADGLIISTPTGSTAYGLSAGGPVLYPTLDALVIVPVCPHTLNARPLVVPVDEMITVKTSDKLLSVAVDGFEKPECVKEISIKSSKQKAILAFLNDDSFYSVLRNKLHWGISPEYLKDAPVV